MTEPATPPSFGALAHVLGSCLALFLAAAGCARSGAAAQAGHRTFWVAPDGDDAGPGSAARPWRTLRRAAAALEPGDTLLLRGGTYAERGIVLRRSGTAAAPITLRAHADEQPTVDGSFVEFRQARGSAWEVADAQREVYRSVARLPGARRVSGYLAPDDGGWGLVTYEDLGPLRSDTEDYEDRWPYYYVGPGVHWNPADQRVYVRLKHSRYQKAMGHRVPAATDTRRAPLSLFPEEPVLELAPGTSHIVIEGIRLRHGSPALHVREGCRHVTVRRCELLGGRYDAIVRGGASDLLFDRIEIPDTFPPWIARSDVKRPDDGRPARQLQGAGIILEGRVERVEIAHSTFRGLFDAIDATGTPIDLNIHHCEFTTIRDDVLEIGSAGYRIEFAHNTIRAAAAGVSWTGSGAPPPHAAGTKYVHHNVIDTSTPMLYSRSDPKGLLPGKWRGPAGDGLASGRAFGTHDTDAISGPDPWRIYHNTIVVSQDVDGSGAGHEYRFARFDPRNAHSVFNNIFVQTADHCIAHGARVHDGSQVWDGNLYHRSAAHPRTPLFSDLDDDGRFANFATLADFVGSTHHAVTRGHHRDGWEAAGVEGDPGLDRDYRPDPRGPAADGAVDLRATGWPGVAAEPHRGARAPR